MRCKELRKMLLEGWSQELPESSRAHLSGCVECRRYARDLGLVRGGFLALAQEPVPEPSWGFTERLLRRLDEAPDKANLTEEFLERVGRRVVYVAGMLALMLLLVLAVPSSGPLRGPTAAELDWGQSEVASMGNDVDFSDESLDSSEAVQMPPPAENPGAENKP